MSEPKPSVAGTVALIVLGLLIFIPSGLCTGVMALAPIIEAVIHNRREDSSMVALGLVIGGPFVLLGGAMLWAGIRRARATWGKPEE